jgi:hypothetical protein
MYPAILHYLDRNEVYETEKPYLCFFPVKDIEGAKLSNLDFSCCHVKIDDLRESSLEPSIDRNGFQWIHHETGVGFKTLKSSQEERRRYCTEIECILKQRLGADYAFTFQTVVSPLGTI